MENNIISYILENLMIFLPIGLTGIIVTIILIVTGKDYIREKERNFDREIFYPTRKKILNLFDLTYFFVISMLLMIGLFSNFIIESIVGFSFAIIPLILNITFSVYFRKVKDRKEG
ncbi:MAG: hypothetical protein V5A68_05810 [Candidatus Thermoplasmatota archaeon]